jgi:hypothetical protein
MQGWVEDAEYPDGLRLPMSAGERAEVDADVFDEFAAALEALEHPDETIADAAGVIAEAARLLRLG